MSACTAAEPLSRSPQGTGRLLAVRLCRGAYFAAPITSFDCVDAQLAHQDANAIRRAYTHAAEYWDERVRMMQVWADYLDELRTAPAKKA
ncbi:hypothetical protein [Ancylobacter rudongensis]|uniref:hypothetical protein n=1 Tax=Ancylobacter rudongensis TaxID=177413 RepID=UPI000B80A478